MDNSKVLLSDYQYALNNLEHKILQRGDLEYVSMTDQIAYLTALSEFPLGRMLIEKGSIDTSWTDSITSFVTIESSSKLENFILNRSPFTLAWRQVLKTFQQLAQQNLKEGITLVSVPCGRMRELLELDFSSLEEFTLIGIDIDLDSLRLAHELAQTKGLSHKLHLLQHDAWQLPYQSEIDLITSCGLNIYVSNKSKVLDLYHQFFKALKPGGQLIISFLTYPPDEKSTSEWQLDRIPPEDLLLERILYENILNPQWRNFRTSDEFTEELKQAGFTNIVFHYDNLHIFPTVVARKAESPNRI